MNEATKLLIEDLNNISIYDLANVCKSSNFFIIINNGEITDLERSDNYDESV